MAVMGKEANLVTAAVLIALTALTKIVWVPNETP
jgi:hypothetical protein